MTVDLSTISVIKSAQLASRPASAVPVMGGSVPTVLSPWSYIKGSVSLAVPEATSSPPRGCVLLVTRAVKSVPGPGKPIVCHAWMVLHSLTGGAVSLEPAVMDITRMLMETVKNVRRDV